jgi:hypothetical protein
MLTNTVILAAVLAFFGSFAVVLFVVSIWTNLPVRPKARSEVTPARRPNTAGRT